MLSDSLPSLTLKTTAVLHLGMFKGLIMISIYGVTDVACVTMEHVFELHKHTIKFIERENESFSVTVANLSSRVRAEIQALMALGD